MSRALWLVALGGCTSDVEVTWLEGFGFEWDLFNHRLSHLQFGLLPSQADVAMVGGTSTTGVSPELPAECDPDTCDEFPFFDEALVEVRAATASLPVATGSATVDLEVGADGATATLEVPLDRRGKGDAIAILDGITLSTDHPLSGGASCYDPAYGWHPRRIRVALGEPVIDGDVATVPVEAMFEAGESLESVRQCVDAVNDQAVVALTVGVRVIAGRGAPGSAAVSQTMEYRLGDGGTTTPLPQDPPDLADRTVALAWTGPYGWSTVDFSFHVDDPEGRGAYLRSLSFFLDPETSSASGHATNYSPGTQLSSFDYTFAGEARALDLGVTPTRRFAADTLEVELDGDGAPVVERLRLEDR